MFRFIVIMLVSLSLQAQIPSYLLKSEKPTLAPVLKGVTKSVVNISTISKTKSDISNPLLSDPFFKKFYEFHFPQRKSEKKTRGVGSGVIIDADKGYVVTNNHVIKSADEIYVTLKDNRRFKARLVGSDSDTDIAILKIEAKNLTEIKHGDSEKLEVGDFVIAIGNPFGLSQTVTSGIVSALGRSGLGLDGYEDFIQTDASINPGNSGGALINLDGELIGINTAIIAPNGGNVGIGFAIPSNMVKYIITQLEEFGEVKRGWLGVVIQDLSPDLAEAMNIKHITSGAVVSDVVDNSPASDAKIEVGDVILEVAGSKVKNSSDLKNKIGLSQIGEKIDIKLFRNGKEKKVSVKISKYKSAKTEVNTKNVPQLEGLELSNNKDGKEGVVISDVKQGSKAWNYGLRKDDVIILVNNIKVKSPNDVIDAVKKNKGALLLNVRRGNAAQFLIIK